MRKVIYSAITGSYDAILQPRVVAEGWDYVMFVEGASGCAEGASGCADGSCGCADGTCGCADGACGQGGEKVGVWEIRRITEDHGGPILTSRYYKLNPQEVLPEYDWWLWVDGNIEILDGGLYEAAEGAIGSCGLAEGAAAGSGSAEGAGSGCYFGLPHPVRDDVAEEILQTHRLRMISYSKAVKLLDFLYKQEGLPRHCGLLENNIILRRNCPAINEFNALWWKMLCTYPTRDQYTNAYCLWKCGIQPGMLLGPGINARNHPGLDVKCHRHYKREPLLKWLKRAVTRRLLALYIKFL